MKATTAAFRAAQALDPQRTYKKAYLYRRQWNGAAYELAASLEITDDYLISVGTMSSQQDLVLGDWRTGNLDVVVWNPDNYWNEETVGGVWDGYIAQNSELEVEEGYLDESNIKHGITTYRGILTLDAVIEHPNKNRATIHLKSLSAPLENLSAEKLPDNQITGENIGTGDGITTEFYTAENGVGIIKSVYVAGTLQGVGLDYSISDTNVKTSPAKITFLAGHIPVSGAITCDYVYWYQDKTIEFLVEKLATDGTGITDVDIQPAIFPSDIQATEIINTDAEFDAGIKEGTYTDSQNKLFEEKIASLAMLDYQVMNTVRIYAQGFKATEDDSFLESTGWLLRTTATSPPIPSFNVIYSFTVELRADNAGSPGVVLETQTILQTIRFQASIPLDVFLWFDGFTNALTEDTQYWITIKKNTADLGPWNISLYQNADSDYTDGSLWISDTGGASWAANSPARNASFAAKIKTTWMSDTIDGTASITSWNTLTQNIIGSVYTLYTRTQAADAAWPTVFDESDWVEIGVGGVIGSTLERYLRIAIRFNKTTPIYSPWTTFSNGSIFETDGYVNSFTITYQTTTILISLANFEGKSRWDSIKALALWPDYEFGVTELNKFFYREKDLSEVVDLNINAIVDISEYKVDWNRIKNNIIATFGIYSVNKNPDTEGEASPNSFNKYGDLDFTVPDSGILSDEQFNLAENIAQIYYDRYKTKKWKVKFKAQLFGQLDGGDFVYLSYGKIASLFAWDHLPWRTYPWASGWSRPYGLSFKVIRVIYAPENMASGMMVEAVEV